MRKTGSLASLALLLALATPAVAAPIPRSGVVHPRLELLESAAIRANPAFGLRGARTPLVLSLSRPPTSADLAALEQAGVVVPRSRAGEPLGSGRTLAVDLGSATAADLAALSFVEKVELDGPPVRAPRPLDLTASLINADATWRSHVGEGPALTGAGVTICDIDNGTDIMHPLFFRADGGYFDFIDTNGNGTLDPDVDQVDLGAGPVTIRAMNGVVIDRLTGQPAFGTEAEELDLTYDYLYADENGDGRRNFGVQEGFTEQTPGYGERLFVLDDVNRSGALDAGEKLVALGTSKIKAFRIDLDVYRRGENLIEVPFWEDMMHGIGSSGVIVAGQPGFSKLVGMAPDADLIMATDTDGYAQYQMMQFCQQEGARVMLHEYAPWVGFHLDGSSQVERLIDQQSADGIAHINPAGNLSTSKKLYKKTVASGSTTTIPIEVPTGLGASYMVFSLLWRDISRDLELTLTRPGGGSFTLPLDSPQGFQEPFDGDLDIAGYRDDSSRGTAMALFYLYPTGGGPGAVPDGTWTLDVVDPTAPGGEPLALFGYVQDEVSGWGLGIHFPEDSSEDHLIGWPGTADHGLAVAAFTGHPFNGATTGERAFYSGRGRRIDDEPLLWISAPDNPIVPTRFEDQELSYLVYGGTSGASPHVTGAAALVIQADPTLSGDGVKEKIRAGAVVDEQTGAVPNEDYGNGKLDVYRAIFGQAPPTGAAPVVDDQSFTVAPGPGELALVASDPDGDALVLEVDREYDGTYDETLAGATVPVDLAEGSYLLKVRATDPSGRTDQALLRVTVQSPADDGEPPGDDDESGLYAAGGGCAVRGAEVPRSGLGLGLGLAAVAILSRLRARRGA